MQRTGRKGHAMFRVVVQDSRYTPTSGKVVAQLGHYDPHTKDVTLDTEKATFYLTNGAQPSERVARLLQSNGVALPDWVEISTEKKRTIKNAEKLRKNQPKVEKPAEEPSEVAEAPAQEPGSEAEAAEVTETAAAPEADEPAAEEAETKEA